VQSLDAALELQAAPTRFRKVETSCEQAEDQARTPGDEGVRISGVTPEARYASLVDQLGGRRKVRHVSEGKGFGSSGQLKVEGRIFAMLVRGELVLKLPRDRVDSLVAAGQGRHFDAGKGRPMREWFVLSPASRRPWTALAKEALEFVEEKR
jgi:hypothetical protein